MDMDMEKSRERDETDTETQTDTKILTRNCEVNMRKGYKRFEKVKWESLETAIFRDQDQIRDFFSTNLFSYASSSTLYPCE